MTDTASQASVSEFIKAKGLELEPEIIAYRRRFHEFPELSTKEFETSQKLCDELDRLGIEYRRVQGPRPYKSRDGRDEFIGTGIIATIKGQAEGAYDADGTPAKRIALRTDMDALPVTERTDVDDAHRTACQAKLDVLLEQQRDLSSAIDQLIADIEAGRKYMKVYKQMKMYNDPALNPVLYGNK